MWEAGDAAPLPEGAEDSAERLFGTLLDGRPEAYQRFAEDYYEVAADIVPSVTSVPCAP